MFKAAMYNPWLYASKWDISGKYQEICDKDFKKLTIQMHISGHIYLIMLAEVFQLDWDFPEEYTRGIYHIKE